MQCRARWAPRASDPACRSWCLHLPGDATRRLPPDTKRGPGGPRRYACVAGGPGQNRTATAEGEGFTDPWAHHLPNRPTEVCACEPCERFVLSGQECPGVT